MEITLGKGISTLHHQWFVEHRPFINVCLLSGVDLVVGLHVGIDLVVGLHDGIGRTHSLLFPRA